MKTFLIYISGVALGKSYVSIWSAGGETEKEAVAKITLKQGQEIVRVSEIGAEPFFINMYV